jgi:hypothetical protein
VETEKQTLGPRGPCRDFNAKVNEIAPEPIQDRMFDSCAAENTGAPRGEMVISHFRGWLGSGTNVASHAKEVLGVDELQAAADRGYYSGAEVFSR